MYMCKTIIGMLEYVVKLVCEITDVFNYSYTCMCGFNIFNLSCMIYYVVLLVYSILYFAITCIPIVYVHVHACIHVDLHLLH